MIFRSAGSTDVGRRRPHNEDAFLTDDELGLYVVGDGVGGNAKGEVASAESVEQAGALLGQALAQAPSRRSWPSRQARTREPGAAPAGERRAVGLLHGVRHGGAGSRAQGDVEHAVVAAVCGSTGFIAQVGDSRVYVVRGTECVQLTEDHTLVNFKLKLGLITPEEAANAPGQERDHPGGGSSGLRRGGHHQIAARDQAIGSCSARTVCMATWRTASWPRASTATVTRWRLSSSPWPTSGAAATTSRS